MALPGKYVTHHFPISEFVHNKSFPSKFLQDFPYFIYTYIYENPISTSIFFVCFLGRNIQSAGLKPGAPSSGANKDNFVICEICDGKLQGI